MCWLVDQLATDLHVGRTQRQDHEALTSEKLHFSDARTLHGSRGGLASLLGLLGSCHAWVEVHRSA